MIKCSCYLYDRSIDDPKYIYTRTTDRDFAQWPDSFLAVPRVGECVVSLCGEHRAKVIKIEHSQNNIAITLV